MVAPLLPLTVRDAEVWRGQTRILGPISLNLGESGITIVLGPNGGGKTTLLRMLHGLERMRRGNLSWSCSREDALKRQAFVFQQPVIMRRSVVESIAYPLLLDQTPKREALSRAAEAAAHVGLAKHLDLPAQVLSGGEKQKMALARALIRKPDLLFLDEPCASLDGQSTREIEDILLRAGADGTRIVMSTHNVGQARRLADEIIFVYRGQLHEIGPAPVFFSGPKTAEATAHINGDLLS
jgi:tungstate transport system ATP-binding protein